MQSNLPVPLPYNSRASSVMPITAYADDMSDTESRAFIVFFVKEIVVSPGNAVVRYSIPMPDESGIPGGEIVGARVAAIPPPR